MRKTMIASLVAVSALALAGCGSNRLSSRERPDEFAVTRAAPLIIPPDFALVPPTPGSSPTATVDTQRDLVNALFGGSASRSVAESATVNATGGANAAPGIRSNVGDPATDVVAKGAATANIVGSREVDGAGARAGAN